MRYPAKEWKGVAILMRDSTYAVLEALTERPHSWSELRDRAKLTDGGLQKVLRELIKMQIVEEILISNETGFKNKRYSLTKQAKKEKLYEKVLGLKESLKRLEIARQDQD